MLRILVAFLIGVASVTVQAHDNNQATWFRLIWERITSSQVRM